MRNKAKTIAIALTNKYVNHLSTEKYDRLITMCIDRIMNKYPTDLIEYAYNYYTREDVSIRMLSDLSIYASKTVNDMNRDRKEYKRLYNIMRKTLEYNKPNETETQSQLDDDSFNDCYIDDYYTHR